MCVYTWMCMPKYMLTHICVGQRQGLQLIHIHACMHTYIHTHRRQDANSQSPAIDMHTTHACIHTYTGAKMLTVSLQESTCKPRMHTYIHTGVKMLTVSLQESTCTPGLELWNPIVVLVSVMNTAYMMRVDNCSGWVCMYVCMYVYKYVREREREYVWTYGLCVCICMYVFIYVCVYVCMYLFM
jgi:hypothetical protein